MWHFIFVDQAGGEEAQQAADILAESLTRQGCRNTLHEEWVSAEGPNNTSLLDTQKEQEQRVYLLFDESLVDSPVLRASLDSESRVLVCTARPAKIILGRLTGKASEVVTVDAQGIAWEEGTDPVSALLGGAARIAPWIDPEPLTAAIWAAYDRGFAYGARAAVRAFDQGYLQTQEAQGTAQPLP